MKILKKSLAIILAFAMVMSLVSVSVFADGEQMFIKVTSDKTDVAKGGSFVMSVYVNAAADNTSITMAGFTMLFDKTQVTLEKVADSEQAGLEAAIQDGMVAFGNLGTLTFDTAEKLACQFNVSVAEGATLDQAITISFEGEAGMDAGFNSYVWGKTVQTPTVKDAITVGSATIESGVTVGLGTSDADVKAALAEKVVTVADKNDTSKTVTTKVDAANWTCANYDKDSKGEYTFVGTLTGSELVILDAVTTVNATVTISSITLTNDMVAFEAPELGIKQDEEATEAITAAAALAHEEVVEVLPTTVAISKDGAYEEEATIAWAVADASATLDLTKRTEDEAANKIAIVGTVTPAADGNYTGTATVNAEIIVVPAQIAGAKVEVKNANTTTVPQVTITVPASEVKDANEVIVTITDGETTKEQKVEAAKADFVIDDKGTEDDATDDTAKLVVKFDEKYNKLGYENGDVITVGVTLNGAALADEDGAPLAIEKTVKKPVSSNSGSNVPTNTVKPDVTPEDPTEDPKDDPTTPDEPVVKPDDPGQVPQTEAPFVDVPADHWAAAPVAQLKEAGVVNGSGDGNFAPEADITRAEFTKMVVGVMGLEVAAAEVAFEDCTAADWFTPYVAAAVEAGLVNGVSETEFAPNATITREQAFAIIGRAIDAEATTAVAFADAADIDEYAAPYVALLVELGIVGGYDDNTIRPDANITRAEAAKLLAGFMDKLNADAEVLPETEEVVEEATEEVVEEEATEEVVEEEATEEVVDEK